MEKIHPTWRLCAKILVLTDFKIFTEFFFGRPSPSPRNYIWYWQSANNYPVMSKIHRVNGVESFDFVISGAMTKTTVNPQFDLDVVPMPQVFSCEFEKKLACNFIKSGAPFHFSAWNFIKSNTLSQLLSCEVSKNLRTLFCRSSAKGCFWYMIVASSFRIAVVH